MSIFDRLFKRKTAISLDDPVFGRLTFEKGIWAFIPNTPTEGFMITVDAPETGPTPRQRGFFQDVRSRLSHFEQLARDFMRSRVDEGVDVPTLSTYSVEIGSAEETVNREFVLELSDLQALVIHRVSFRAEAAVDYGFDD
jgi:hypothetical protein